MNKKRYKGLTLVEILTVLVVMALLIGILLPAIAQVTKIANQTKQRAQFATISIGLESFRNDFGDYPPSDNSNNDYCGAQKLSEAMVGYDLFGFHPKTNWESDGSLSEPTKYGNDYDNNRNNKDLIGRETPYIEVEKANSVRLGNGSGGTEGLYSNVSLNSLEPDTYVLTDIFKRKYTFDIDGDGSDDTVKSGMPILYFKARTNKYKLNSNDVDSIFDYTDNEDIVESDVPWDDTKTHELDDVIFYDTSNTDDNGYITNKALSSTTDKVPYNKDSFILISAGKDGLYGTEDDIFNFEKQD